MSSHINTANALAMNASSAFHALSSECIQYAKMLEERDKEIAELKNSLKMRGGIFPEEVEELTAHYEDECDKNEKLTEEIKELKSIIERDSGCEENARLTKELAELKEQLEPLQDAMDGWTGVCDFQDVVDYVDRVREDGEEQVEDIKVILNDVRDKLEKRFPKGMDNVFLVPESKDVAEWIEYIDNNQ